MNKLFFLPILPFFLFLIAGCASHESADVVLEKTKNKLHEAGTIHYNYRRETNNIFNETRMTDSVSVAYYRLGESQHGFGLHARAGDQEYFYNGFQLKLVNHIDKAIISIDRSVIKADPNYFDGFSFFSTNPLIIRDLLEYDTTYTLLLEEKTCFVFKQETQQPSHTDSSKIVRYQNSFVVSPVSYELKHIKNIVIRDEDTLQIVDHYFSDFVYGDVDEVFPTIDPVIENDYAKVMEEDEEFVFSPIKVGERLSKSIYTDSNQNQVAIYGADDKSCLIMFSFIGCTPCEVALKDFNDVNYNFTKDVNFYYSSFQNPGSTLKRYLEKKNFPNTAFGKESNMIEAFSLYTAPSFVFFDSSGTILKVIEGYNEGVKEELFAILMPD